MPASSEYWVVVAKPVLDAVRVTVGWLVYQLAVPLGVAGLTVAVVVSTVATLVSA